MWVLDKLGFSLLDNYCKSGLNRYSCPWHLGFKTRATTLLVLVLCDIQWATRPSSQIRQSSAKGKAKACLGRSTPSLRILRLDTAFLALLLEPTVRREAHERITSSFPVNL